MRFAPLVEDDQAVFETLIPRCDASASVKPCWHIDEDPLNCQPWHSAQNQALEVERHDYPRLGTHVRGSCVTR